MTFTEKENILEIESLNSDIPSFSCYIHEEMGYYLYALKNKWVFPFRKTKIKLNIAKAVLPDNTIGLISGERLNYDVINKRVLHEHEYSEVTIVSKRLFPFKIIKGSVVAILSIVPSLECYTVEHKKLSLKDNWFSYIIMEV